MRHPAFSHHLQWVKKASQDGAGLLDKFIISLPTCCQDAAAAPADYTIENGPIHHRVIGKLSGVPSVLHRTLVSSADGVCSELCYF